MTGICMSIRITSKGWPVFPGNGSLFHGKLPVLDHRHSRPPPSSSRKRSAAGCPDRPRPAGCGSRAEWPRQRLGATRLASGRPLRSGDSSSLTPCRSPVSTVTLNVLPLPGMLLIVMSPPSISASRLLIVSPSPVPPSFRVVDESAWLNGRNNSGDLPLRQPDARCRSRRPAAMRACRASAPGVRPPARFPSR